MRTGAMLAAAAGVSRGYKGATAVAALLKEAVSSSDPWVTSSIEVAAHSTVLLAIQTTTDVDPDGVTGLGLTWTKVARVFDDAAGNSTCAVWWAYADSAKSGAVTVDWPTARAGSVDIVQVQLEGTNQSAPVAQFRTDRLTDLTDGGSNTNAKVVLQSAVSGVSLGFAACSNTTPTWTEGSGYTPLGLNDAPKEIEAEYKAVGSTTVQFTMSSGMGWAMVGVEVR